MKKLIAIVAALFCFTGISFAEELDELTKDKQAELMVTRTIVPEDQHTTNKTAKVQIDYTPLTDEAHVYYTCIAVSYDQGEAMNTVMACMQKFVKDNKYYNYKYMQDDRVKYFRDDRGQRRAMYSSHIKLIR